MSAELGVRVERDGDAVRLELTGEIDLATAERAQAAVDEALATTPSRLTVSLAGVSFIDSHGIWLIVECHRRALRGGFELAVETGASGVRRALEFAGLERLVTEPPGGDALAIRLVLYISGEAGSSIRAVAAARELVARLDGRAELELVDVLADPARAAEGRIIATPTLVREQPPPPARLIGEFGDAQALARHLGLGPIADAAA